MFKRENYYKQQLWVIWADPRGFNSKFIWPSDVVPYVAVSDLWGRRCPRACGRLHHVVLRPHSVCDLWSRLCKSCNKESFVTSLSVDFLYILTVIGYLDLFLSLTLLLFKNAQRTSYLASNRSRTEMSHFSAFAPAPCCAVIWVDEDHHDDQLQNSKAWRCSCICRWMPF